MGHVLSQFGCGLAHLVHAVCTMGWGQGQRQGVCGKDRVGVGNLGYMCRGMGLARRDKVVPEVSVPLPSVSGELE